MHLSASGAADRQRDFLFPSEPFAHASIEDALRGLFDNRCAFCTTPIGAEFSVHRLRPNQGSISFDGGVDRRSYYWLAYAWENLYPACGECSTAQGRQFPVYNSRAKPGTAGRDLHTEEPALLDPCHDNPEDHLIYLPTGQVAGKTPRGEITVDTFALNRPVLIDARRSALAAISPQLDALVRSATRFESAETELHLRGLFDLSPPFAAMRRQFAFQKANFRRARLRVILGETYETVTVGMKPTRDADMRDAAVSLDGSRKAQQMKFESLTTPRRIGHGGTVRSFDEESTLRRIPALTGIRIQNFKGLKEFDLSIDASAGSGTWTMLLGDNGTGKTSVLQAIALALAGPSGADLLKTKTSELLTNGESVGYVEVFLEGLMTPLGFELRHGKKIAYHSPLEVPFSAFGSTRLLAKRKSRQPDYRSADYENLFDPHVSLAPHAAWIPDLDQSDFDAVGRSLLTLLTPTSDHVYFDRTHNGTLILRGGDRNISVDQMSSGFQSTLAMALDLMRGFLSRWASIEDAEGIVLIDEIEVHLHPRWQMRIVQSLRQLFPRVQFVATSHSPLVLQGLRSGEIQLLSPDGNSADDMSDEVDIRGMTVDQILTSNSFGLNSTSDANVDDLFRSYYNLLSNARRTDEEQSQLLKVKVALKNLRHFGETRRERLALEAADAYLAEKGNRAHGTLSDERKRELLYIWQNLDSNA